MCIFWTLFFAFFFLFWTFCLSSAAYAFSRLGYLRTTELAKRFPNRLFYFKLHAVFFKHHTFELLVYAARIGENLARLGFGISVTLLLFYCERLAWSWSILFGLIFLFLYLLICELLPRLFSTRSAEKVLIALAGCISFFLLLTFPISFSLLRLTTFFAKKTVQTDPIELMKEEVVEILLGAEVEGRLNATEKKLIESIMKFKDRIVREVMVPRVDLFSLPAETPIRDAAKKLVGEGYSRIPVFRDNIDNIIGVLMYKDFFQLYMECAEGKQDTASLNAPIETIVKPVFYTPETNKVSHLLQEFRSRQMHMAIVVDEYGGTEGVVTIEDILEEIVGEIADEYDIQEEMLYTALPGGGWIADAHMSIFDAEETFGLHIPQEGEYDTIGGYLLHKFGTIPQKGMKIQLDEFDLEILSSSARSVDKIRITKREIPEEKKEES